MRLAVGLAVLLGTACAVSWRAGLGAKVARAQATAAARAVVQLAVVALALRGVFAAPLAAVAVIVVMFSVATWTSARRLAGLEQAGQAVVAGCALGAGLTITAVVALPTLDRDVRTLVAVSEIIIGNSMTASTLAGRHLREGLHRRRDEIEAWLSLVRSAAAEALVPGMDQTRTVGLVTLPGAFIGALLSGATRSQPPGSNWSCSSACSARRPSLLLWLPVCSALLALCPTSTDTNRLDITIRVAAHAVTSYGCVRVRSVHAWNGEHRTDREHRPRDDMDEIPMPQLLDPNRLVMPERDDMTIDEHRGRTQAALDALRATCDYGQMLRDELIAVRDYLHGHNPQASGDDAEWTAWSSRYASVTSVLAGPHGDNGFGAEEAHVTALYARQGQTPPPRPE